MRRRSNKFSCSPPPGDAGLAIGAAYFVHHQVLGQPRSFVMEDAYWGPGYSPEQMRAAVAASRLQSEGMEISELPEEADCQGSGEGNRRGKNSRLVSRARRMGAARAGESQHRRRSAPRRT